MKKKLTDLIFGTLLMFSILSFSFGCKSAIVHPNEFSIGQITIYPNHTYDFIYTEFDVTGSLVFLGEYEYVNDTLILTPNSKIYIDKQTQLIPIDCDEEKVTFHFKEFLGADDENGNMMMYWADTKLIGVNSKNDTSTIWHPNGWSGNTDFTQISFDKSQLVEFDRVWIEQKGRMVAKEIQLLNDYQCLDITVPIIHVPKDAEDKNLIYGMNRFVIYHKRKNRYKVDIVDRKVKINVKYPK